MTLDGIWFDGKTSASIRVFAQIDDTGLVSVVNVASQSVIATAPLSSLKISARLGNTPRYLYFEQAEKLETKNNDLIDAWIQRHHSRDHVSWFHRVIYRLETHLAFVISTVVLILVMSWALVVYGFPAAAKHIAFMLPASVMNQAAKETLAILDKAHLKPSQLDEQTRARILKQFSLYIEQNPELNIHVVFRAGGKIGANAFALPDGTVIFTDEIVRLAKHDNELLAVFAHEMGHVKYRHSLRAAIQGSAISFAIAMLTGDLSSASSLLASLPVILTTMSYSRDFEREADDNALAFLDQQGIARHYFIDLMDRLTYQAECQYYLALSASTKGDAAAPPMQDEKNKSASKNEDSATAPASVAAEPEFDYEKNKDACDKVIAAHANEKSRFELEGFFATHPQTEERVAKFRMQKPVATPK